MRAGSSQRPLLEIEIDMIDRPWYIAGRLVGRRIIERQHLNPATGQMMDCHTQDCPITAALQERDVFYTNWRIVESD
jgi:hypothetical protein